MTPVVAASRQRRFAVPAAILAAHMLAWIVIGVLSRETVWDLEFAVSGLATAQITLLGGWTGLAVFRSPQRILFAAIGVTVIWHCVHLAFEISLSQDPWFSVAAAFAVQAFLVAFVAAVVNWDAAPGTGAGPPTPNRDQYSLRTLLLVATGFGLLAAHWQRVLGQQDYSSIILEPEEVVDPMVVAVANAAFGSVLFVSVWQRYRWWWIAVNVAVGSLALVAAAVALQPGPDPHQWVCYGAWQALLIVSTMKVLPRD
jgi:hypothetical protein